MRYAKEIQPVGEEPLLQFSAEGRIAVGHIRSASVLDAVNVSQFGKEVEQFVEQNATGNLLLDFRDVNYLSSAVLSQLICIRRQCKTLDGDLRLCAIRPEIKRVFEITNLSKMFVIYDHDAGEAAKRFDRSLDIANEDETWGSAAKGT